MSMRSLVPAGAAVLLVMGLIVAAPGLAFKSGTYSGTTSQDDEGGDPHDLQLKVNRKKTRVTVVFFELEADPCKGTGGLQYAGLKAKIRDDGTFKAKSPADGFYGYVKGRLHGRVADGKARYHFDASGCESGIVTWEAHKGL
jgi:hypothetical protein